MSAFAAAMDALAADPNTGTDAIYRANGAGAPVSIRVVRSAPDRLGDAFSTSVIQASDVLAVAIAVLPSVEPDDSFALAAALGAFGAMARFGGSGQALLTRDYLLQVLAGGSLGTGAWLLAYALGLGGWWLFAVAWLAGTLGYAALHDLLLRILSQKFGGR